MQLEPLYDRVVILPDEPPTESPGGIAYPSSSLTLFNTSFGRGVTRGKVVAIDTVEPSRVVAGDYVHYPTNSGYTIEACGHKYVILKTNEVLVVERDDDGEGASD